MFLGNDTGIAYNNFNQFSGSKLKYLVDIAGVNHHMAGYQSSWCTDFRNSMLTVNPAVFPQVFIDPSVLNKSDIVNYVYDATFYFSYTGGRESLEFTTFATVRYSTASVTPNSQPCCSGIPPYWR